MPDQTDSQVRIRRIVSKARQRIYTMELLSQVLAATAWFLIGLLVFVIVDHWLLLAPLLRFAAGAVVVAPALAILIRFFRRHTRLRLNDLYVARELEKAHPHLKNDLINALQSARADIAAARTVPASLRLPGVPGNVARWTCAVALALLGWVLYCLAAVQPVALSAGRILLPWQNTWLPTKTVIRSISPADNTDLIVDRNWQIRVETANVPPRNGHVSYRVPTSEWKTMDLIRDVDDGAYYCTMPPMNGKLHFHVDIGDARSRLIKVNLLRRTIIEERRVLYEFPRYLGMKPHEDTNLAIEAVVDTLVHFELEMDEALEKAELIWNGQSEPMLVNQRSVRTIRRQRIHKDAAYSFRFWPRLQLAPIVTQDYPIKAHPDEKPKISILSPNTDVESRVDGLIPFIYAVADDFRIEAVDFCAVFYGTRDVVSIPIPSRRSFRQFEGEWVFRPQVVGAVEGDRIICYMRARDANPDGIYGESESYTIRILPPRTATAAAGQPLPDDADTSAETTGDYSDSELPEALDHGHDSDDAAEGTDPTVTEKTVTADDKVADERVVDPTGDEDPALNDPPRALPEQDVAPDAAPPAPAAAAAEPNDPAADTSDGETTGPAEPARWNDTDAADSAGADKNNSGPDPDLGADESGPADSATPGGADGGEARGGEQAEATGDGQGGDGAGQGGGEGSGAGDGAAGGGGQGTPGDSGAGGQNSGAPAAGGTVGDRWQDDDLGIARDDVPDRTVRDDKFESMSRDDPDQIALTGSETEAQSKIFQWLSGNQSTDSDFDLPEDGDTAVERQFGERELTMVAEQHEEVLDQETTDETLHFEMHEIPADVLDLINNFKEEYNELMRQAKP